MAPPQVPFGRALMQGRRWGEVPGRLGNLVGNLGNIISGQFGDVADYYKDTAQRMDINGRRANQGQHNAVSNEGASLLAATPGDLGGFGAMPELPTADQTFAELGLPGNLPTPSPSPALPGSVSGAEFGPSMLPQGTSPLSGGGPFNMMQQHGGVPGRSLPRVPSLPSRRSPPPGVQAPTPMVPSAPPTPSLLRRGMGEGRDQRLNNPNRGAMGPEPMRRDDDFEQQLAFFSMSPEEQTAFNASRRGPQMPKVPLQTRKPFVGPVRSLTQSVDSAYDEMKRRRPIPIDEQIER